MSHNTDVLSIRRDTLQELYNAVLAGDEEGLAVHAEPVQAARMILEQPGAAIALSVDDQVTALRRNGLSIDGDNAYKRDLMDTITGAMAFGFQNANPPPEGHWGKRFWDIGRAEGAERDRLTNQRDAILLQARVWAGEAKTQQAITREVGEILGGIPCWGPIAASVEALNQRVTAIELMREHRIAVTPEHEGQWHADLYGHEAEPLISAEGETPEQAVHAVMAMLKASHGADV